MRNYLIVTKERFIAVALCSRHLVNFVGILFHFSFHYMKFPDMIIKVSFQSVIWEDLILSLLCGNYVKHHSDRDKATSAG